MGNSSTRKRWPWIVAAALVVLLVPVAWVVVPILTHDDAGESSVVDSGEEWPLSVTAEGDDGRTRTLDIVASEPGESVDTSALAEGQRIVVSGAGYDTSQGIYVAICKIAPDASTKPGPCLGGVPETGGGDDVTEKEPVSGVVEYAPSNWINDDWAWKLFGARSYDDAATGTFTAFIEVPSPVGEGLDCRVDACAVYTRNDHTALSDRVQDVSVPVGFGD